MEVAVAGGHGKIGLRLLRLLAERGDRARGLIRNPDHAADLEAVGALPVGADLENLDPDAIAESIAGCEAVVFAAGAGPGSGPARKHTVDYGRRREADRGREAERDVALRDGERDGRPRPGRARRAHASLLRGQAPGRPGARGQRPRLHDRSPGPAHRRSRHGADRGRRAPGANRRDSPRRRRRDPARLPRRPNTIGRSFDLLGGQTPIAEALAALSRPAEIIAPGRRPGESPRPPSSGTHPLPRLPRRRRCAGWPPRIRPLLWARSGHRVDSSGHRTPERGSPCPKRTSPPPPG